MKTPNIVLILSDDQGNWAMNCAGNEEIITPNLNRIADTGMMFDNFYCASPVCSPARLSLFTGKIPSQHGVVDWIADGHCDYEELDEDLKENFKKDTPDWEYLWPKDQLSDARAIRFLEGHRTFTEALAENGYTCGISGKWHMGDAGKPQAGFTWWRTLAMGGDNYKYPVVLKDGSFGLLRDKYITRYITENALEFLDEQRGAENPFYLSVHYTAPHAPWDKHHHEEKVYELYDDCKFESVPDLPAHPWGTQYESEEHRKQARRRNLQGFFAAVTSMDQCIGQILDKLEEMGVRENTIVIFTGDNGMCMGHHGFFGKGNGTTPMNMYDQSVQVPFLVSHLGHIPQGGTEHGMFSHFDVYRTLMDYLDIDEHFDEKLPGISFAPILRGEQMDGKDHIVIADEYGPVRMVRTKEWKYVHRYLAWEGINELYDLVNDPEEANNLYGQPGYDKITAQMREKLFAWYDCHVDENYDASKIRCDGNGQIERIYPRAEKDTDMFRLQALR